MWRCHHSKQWFLCVCVCVCDTDDGCPPGYEKKHGWRPLPPTIKAATKVDGLWWWCCGGHMKTTIMIVWNNNNTWLYRNSGKQLDSGWIWMEITIDWTTWHNMYSLHRANVDDGHNVTNNKDMLPHPIFTKGKQVHVRLSLPKQSLSPIVCLSPSTTMMMMMMMMMMCLYCCYRVLRGKPSGRHRQWNQQLNWFNNFFRTIYYTDMTYIHCLMQMYRSDIGLNWTFLIESPFNHRTSIGQVQLMSLHQLIDGYRIR